MVESVLSFGCNALEYDFLLFFLFIGFADRPPGRSDCGHGYCEFLRSPLALLVVVAIYRLNLC